MVKKESPVYLLIGQDNLAKDIELKKIEERFIPAEIRDFNRDVLYADQLTLQDTQEAFLRLPVETKKRIIVIRGAQELKEDIREFILDYVKKPLSQLILVLDITRPNPRDKDEFINRISRFVQMRRFKESVSCDTFTLARQIELKKPDGALRILNQLLQNGERPERIMGGLRYSWERSALHSREANRRFKLLLSCDVEIKTGKIKPLFALERLVIRLCYLDRMTPG